MQCTEANGKVGQYSSRLTAQHAETCKHASLCRTCDIPVPCHHAAHDISASGHWTACVHMLPSADWLHMIQSAHVALCAHQDCHDNLPVMNNIRDNAFCTYGA